MASVNSAEYTDCNKHISHTSSVSRSCHQEAMSKGETQPQNIPRSSRPASGGSSFPTSPQSASSPSDAAARVKKQRADFKFGKILGEGSYSEVVLATEISTGRQYAIKVLEKKHILRERKEKCVIRERDILSKLDHPFFVKLYFTFQDANKLYFGLSLAKRGELLPYIKKLGSFDENSSRFYTSEIILALKYLHSRGIIHRDLKPENILLNEDMHIQITDFGTAKIIGTDDAEEGAVRANSFVGTAQYVSPELLTEKSATKSSDLWALGCIVYQLQAGLPPFRASNEYMIFQKIIKLEYDYPDGFSKKARDLVSKLLVIDPSKRLGCDECGGYPALQAHPFLDGVDWENLHKQKAPELKPCTVVDGKEIHSDYYLDDFDLESNPTSLSDYLKRIETPDRPRSPTRDNKYIVDLTHAERAKRLEKQRKENKWHQFVEGNLILKNGWVDKRKGLFARRRMLLLTEGPHLYYVDPENMVLKGEIPWSPQLRVEAKNFKTYFVHTPNRTYYLIDPESDAVEWCQAIKEMYRHTYQQSI
ncbi:3-phosphoinositide-dependent protein kinase 1-like [Diadema antillarum]|uniref:3-phosphoinositide-dependent protein kinase 1-like n=1 Tax=Diadema antillarum TaxID=105358 RepID=UPI003A8648D8